MNLSLGSVTAVVLSLLLISSISIPIHAQEGFEANYDESKVPDYELPELLEFPDGTPVTTPEQWREKRRPQILELFKSQMYGSVPGGLDNLRFETIEKSRNALNGTAIRKQVRIHLEHDGKTEDFDLLMYVPNDAEGPVPTFLILNFDGNHAVHPDPAILLPDHPDDPDERGSDQEYYPVEDILARGYGFATVYNGDIDPDYNNFDNGVHPLFYEEGQTKPAPDEWGSITAWAWGLSRVMDYFEQEQELIDESCVAVVGHSRLGKTSLWAGARDQRFAMAISNNSGAGGAALSRRRFGETVWVLNSRFPHWFADNFTQYNKKESELPIDQHMLIALMAPRPVYVASAQEDQWADPRGEFLSAKNAEPVYKLLNAGGMDADEWPDVGQQVMSTIGYHLRPGGHGLRVYDWKRYLDFADRYLECE